MNILAIDSSSKAASVAIVRDGKLVGDFFINTKITHSQTLLPMVDALLKSTKTKLSDIDTFAVSVGPGSFTGVRIGVCAIKGLAMASNKPCVAISTLLSMAYNLINSGAIVCAVMDARRGQVYNALFDVNNGKVSRICEDRAISIGDLAKELKCAKYVTKKVILLGDAANMCYNKLLECGIDLQLAPEHLLYERASSVAFAAIDADKTVSAEELVPVYLRMPQAERERLQKQRDTSDRR